MGPMFDDEFLLFGSSVVAMLVATVLVLKFGMF